MSQPTWIGYKLNDRYLIEQELGAGGMSAVYRANDPNLKRIVAIKLIHSHLSNNPDFVRRFETEASAVAQLRHPNIVQVYDFNNDGETYYMVLEFVAGESLQERLKRLNKEKRKMAFGKVIELSAKICDAVEYAHKRGLVHRDIKPANVMLDVHGEPILMDFGIVKILGGTQHTATGAVVGTALYMSPEQIRGEHADHRADIYSLGVMLYEMVSGKPPYEADSAMTIMMKHLNDPIPDIPSDSDAVPPGIKNIIAKALAKDANERYQSAGQMAADLRALLSSAPTAQSPTATVIETPTAASTIVEPTPPPAPEATYVEPVSKPVQPAPSPKGTSTTTQPPPPRQPAQPAEPAASGIFGNRMLLFGGGGALLVILACVIVGAIFLPRLIGGTSVVPTATLEIAAVTSTNTPEPTDPPATPTTAPPTATPTPTSTPTITPTPTPTVPVGPYVLITDIIKEGGVYRVFYEVFNFDPIISASAGTNHIHFFWNTYAPETVGIKGIGDSVGGGSWILYDKPSPFSQFTTISPQGTTQICALVANHDHSIILETGNCFDIPE